MSDDVVYIASMPPSVHISTVGVTFTEDISEADWSRLLQVLARTEDAVQFAIGDALNYGESKYGETYSQAMDATGRTYQALANYVWVSRAVPMEVRNPNLSWTRHRIVAKLPPNEQRDMLTAAENNQWTVDELAEVVRGKPVEPKVIETVKVPTGMAPIEAEKILKTAQKCSKNLCETCPYR